MKLQKQIETCIETMTSEAPSTSGQQLYKDTAYVLSSGRIAAERNVNNNICIQTGEEFSTEFLRRLPVISEVEQHQPKRVGYKFNQNHQLVYEDLTGILGLQRIDSEYSSEFSELVAGTGFGTEAENKAYTDNINRYHWEYGKFADQLTPGPSAPPVYVVESPHSYYPYGPEFSEDSFSGKIKVLCSFGGRILPRPSDGKLRYVGGETRIISIRKNITWEELTKKISAICNQPHTIKYQLPGEDLDALVSVCSDEDLFHMIEEYQELERIKGSHRLRIFLVSSNEPESPSSMEGRAAPAQPSNADYQYVFAVNGTVDRSPRKSSSGQSLTSQTSQLGNASDYSPTFHRDSPTSAFALEIKDCSPSSSNLVGMFSKSASQFLTTLQIPSKTFNQSPPISPVQNRDPKNSNVQIYVDQKRSGGHQSILPFVIEKLPCENPYSLDAIGYYNNLPRPPLMDYHHPKEYLVETDQANKSQNRHFHRRSPSNDFVHSPSCCQNDFNYERKMLKERAFHSDKVASNPDDLMGLQSGLNDIDVSHHKIMHAFSDSQLQEHDERSNCYFPLSSLSTEREKSPFLAMSNFPLEWRVQCEERINEKQQMNKYENQPTSKIPGDCKGNVELGQEMFSWIDRNITCSNQNQKHLERNVEVPSHDNVMELEKLPDLNYLPCVCQSSQEQQNLRGGISISSDGYPRLLPVASQGLDGQESMDSSCVSMSPYAETNFYPKFSLYENNTPMYALFQKTTTGAVLSGEAPLHDTDPRNHPDYQVQMVGLSQSQPSDSHPENKMESVVIVKDITDCTPPGIPFSSKVVPRIEDEACDDFPSPRKSEAKNSTSGSECEVKFSLWN